MKLIVVTSIYGLTGGGAGMVAEQLAKGMLERNWEAVVIAIGNNKGISHDLEDGIRVYRFYPKNLYSLQDKASYPKWERALWQLVDIYNPYTGRILKKIIAAEKPDIIHIHKMRGLSGSVWTVSTSHCPGRVVQTCHDFESMSPEGTLQGKIGQWALERRWPIRGYQLVRAYLSREISVLSAPSDFALSTIQRSGLFPAAQKKVVPNSHGWTADELKIIQSKIVFSKPMHLLYLGRLEPEKGLRELCTAITSLTPMYPELRLSIAGWGSMEKELIRICDSEQNITFTGKVSGEEKNQLISSASALIVPSTCRETFGMVVVEAFAFGKPVIASRIGGLQELVRDGETGLLVEPGDVDALKQAIIWMINNPDQLSVISSACFKEAEMFTLENMVSQYENLYQDLLVD